MGHSIYRVVSFEIQGPYTLRVCFDDDTEQVIDFQDTLEGELFAPLRNRALFNQVQIDPEVYYIPCPRLWTFRLFAQPLCCWEARKTL